MNLFTGTRQEQWKYIFKVFPLIDLVFGILVVALSRNRIITVSALVVIPALATLIMYIAEKKKMQPGFMIAGINGSLFLIIAYYSGYESPTWLWMINLTVGASFLFNNPFVGQILISFFSIFLGFYFYWLGASPVYSINISLILLAFLILFSRAYSYLQFQQLKIESKSNELEMKNKNITDSISYALRIQTAILPPTRLIKQYLENSFILYKPKDIVAGDFYWMETVDDTVLFAACDCTGHGVPGAMVSVVCHNALNRAVREFGLIQPAAILDKTAEIVIENFSKSEEDIKDGMDISLCAYNSKTKTIQWAGANNPIWLIQKGELIETKANKQPIGMNENKKPFTNHIFNIGSGDTIYLFTDGFADQFGGETGEKKLTKKRFKELLLSIQNKSMQEQGIALDKFITEYRKEVEQIDDILVIGVRV